MEGFHALPTWQQRLYIRCAVEEDRRVDEKINDTLKIIFKAMGGGSDEPTSDRPVIETSSIDGKTETVVKKVFDWDFDNRVKKLAEDSMKFKKETQHIVDKMKREALEKERAKEREKNG